MTVKVLVDETDNAIIKVELGNLSSRFIQFHVHDGHFYIKDVGMSVPFKLLEKAKELEKKRGFKEWKSKLNHG